MHVSVLLRLGKDVIVNRRERSYRPDNILTVLEDMEATYTPSRPAHRTRPDILVVDWSGVPIKPDAQGCQSVTKMIQEARQRMR
jgi:hypothetical protein